MYVVMTGPPASGKTTLSSAIGAELGLPVLAKDEIKRDLLTARPAGTVDASRERGRAAVRLLLSAAREAGEAVLDSVWVDRAAACRDLAALPGVVEVFCRCDPETTRRRYRERADSPGAGHLDLERGEDELWPESARRPLAGPWPVLEVDTSHGQVDALAVAAAVRDLARRS